MGEAPCAKLRGRALGARVFSYLSSMALNSKLETNKHTDKNPP